MLRVFDVALSLTLHTFTFTVAVLPSAAVTVIFTEPFATAFILPYEETVAMDLSLVENLIPCLAVSGSTVASILAV